MKRTYTILLIIFCSVPAALAQKADTIKPRRIIIIDQQPSTSIKTTDTTTKGSRDIYKIDLKPFRGNLIFNYERSLQKHFSVDAGLGITVVDFISSMASELTYPQLYGPDGEEASNPFDISEYTKMLRPGYCANATFKYWPSPEYLLEGSSLGLYLGYKYHNNATTPSMGLSFNTPARIKEVALMYSYQYENNIFSELYLGLGYRISNVDYIYRKAGNLPYNMDRDYYGMASTRFTMVSFLFGVKYGIDFKNR